MKCEEFKTLYNKKKGEGKSKMQIYAEIDNLKKSQIILKNKDKEIKTLNKLIKTLEKENNKLKNENLKLGLKNKTTMDYHERPFPRKSQIRRVKVVLKSNKSGMTMNDIKQIAYGLTLGIIRDCLMVLYHMGEIEINGDTYVLT